MKTFRTACDPWGITVERVEVGGSASAVWAYHDIVVRGHCHRAVYLWVNAMPLYNNLANFPVSRWRTWAWRGTWWRASRWRPRPAGRPTVSSSCRRARAAAWRKLSKDQVHSDIHVLNKCCRPSNCDKSPEQCAIVTPYYVCRAAADEMQECSASIVLKYLQVQCTSHSILHILFRK